MERHRLFKGNSVYSRSQVGSRNHGLRTTFMTRLLNTQTYNAAPKICRRYEMEYTGGQSQGWQSDSQQTVCDALPAAN